MKIPRGLVKVYKGQLGHAARQFIKSNLTVVPESTSSFKQFSDPIRLWHDDGENMYLPRGYYNSVVKMRFAAVGDFKWSFGSAELRPSTPIVPREGQEQVISAAITEMTSHAFGGTIIEAKTASGKTPIAMEIARRLGMKTLFVVHTSVLMEQWIVEIKKFMPSWSIGVIRGPTCDTENNDVCIAMLQSLALGEDYPQYLYDEFGLVVFDEIHQCASAEFMKAIYKFRSKYILGLSGTLERKDKAQNVFIHGIGKVIQAMATIDVLKPTIYMINTSHVWTGGGGQELDRQKNKFLESLIFDQARNELILQNTVKAVLAGRHVLLLSERVSHVQLLHLEIMKRLPNIHVGIMVGSTKKEQRDAALDAQVLLATVQLLGTGFNNPRLDTLIMCTPIQSNEQSVGRILRQHPEKKQPIVLDLVDPGSNIGKIFSLSRLKRYKAKGWKVVGSECLR